MRLRFVVLAMMVLTIVLGCAFYGRADERKVNKEVKVATMEIKSNAFKQGETIPARHTCDGDDVSPQLSWSKAPAGAKELVLICDDPDAPMGGWVHWVLYGLPPDTTGLPEGVPKQDSTAFGARQGKNDFGKIGYGGPCPPRGSTHRYFFKLYAVDKKLDLKPRATKWDALKAMEGHILAQGELMGRYAMRQ